MEVTPMAQATHRLLSPSPGAISTLALFYARQEAKAQLKAQGIKVSYVEAKDITAAGRALLAEHWQEYSETPTNQRLRLCKCQARK
jgi:hypothetical protein